MKKFFLIGLFCLFTGPVEADVRVDSPTVVLTDVAQDLVLIGFPKGSQSATVKGLGSFPVKDGRMVAKRVAVPQPLKVRWEGHSQILEISRIPGWWSLLPPLCAVVLAFLLKDVFVSLFLGILLGELFLSRFHPLEAIAGTVDGRFVSALADSSHIRILMFTIGMAAFIGLLRKSGGLYDLIDRVRQHVSSPRSGMLATWGSGLIIFFDDYANSLLIGNMLRPLTDRLRISREKLSYIVDATAAPVASLAISTWVGTEISLMLDSYQGIDPQVGGMTLFIETIPYRFYPLLTLFFVFLVCFWDRDFGPMAVAERRSRLSGQVLSDHAVPMQDHESQIFDNNVKKGKWYQAAVPLVSMVLFIVAYMYISGGSAVGFSKPFTDILDASSTTTALMFGPLFGISCFVLLAQRLFSLRELVDTLVSGSKTVMIAVFILTLAWSIGSLCKDLNTAEYLMSLIGSDLPAQVLPALVFVLSALAAFATGTSWGTMAIMFPIVVPLTHHLLEIQAISGELHQVVLYATMGSILSGATLGDHASPISDTTLFSSMACGADHIDHVKTQAPYALCVGGISIVTGYAPLVLGLHWFWCLLLGMASCVLVVRLLGKANPVYSTS